jgi:TPR repeat protein
MKIHPLGSILPLESILNIGAKFSHHPRGSARPMGWLNLPGLLLALACYATSSNCAAASGLAATDSVFRFQSKMAQRGHVASQYALAYMYESGQGTDKDLSLATDWYRKAATQGFVPAKDRLVYIDILNNGYQQQKQQQWLLSLKQGADDYNYKHQGESAFLLGQLYASGLAVNKSLTRARKYLHMASAANVIGSDSEIRRVEAELQALRETYIPETIDAPAQTGKKPPLNNKTSTVKKPQTSTRPAQAGANKAAATQNRKAEVKRYEAPKPRPVSRPATQPAPQSATRAATRSVTQPGTQPGAVDKRKIAASPREAKSTQPAASVPAQNSPPTEQNSKTEQQKPHPMDLICSGWQRMSSGCR